MNTLPTPHTPGEFDDLLGLRPHPMVDPVPHAARREPVTIDHATQKPITPTARKASAAALRQLAADLVSGNREKMQHCIDEIMKVSPKAAMDILLQLMEFSTPRLKAVAMQIEDTTPGAGNMRKLSTAELERMVRDE